MAAVYEAHQLSVERRVALKLIAPGSAPRAQLVAETRAVMELEHPNVVPVYAAGEADGLVFIAMRLIEGADLQQIIDGEGPLDPARVAAVVAQVASALDAA